MKKANAILFVFLILKGTIGFGGIASSSANCCSSVGDLVEESMTTSPEDSEEEKNCCGTDCDCVCCIHTLVSEKNNSIQFVYPEIPNSGSFYFVNTYTRQISNLIWHPPQ